MSMIATVLAAALSTAPMHVDGRPDQHSASNDWTRDKIGMVAPVSHVCAAPDMNRGGQWVAVQANDDHTAVAANEFDTEGTYAPCPLAVFVAYNRDALAIAQWAHDDLRAYPEGVRRYVRAMRGE